MNSFSRRGFLVVGGVALTGTAAGRAGAAARSWSPVDGTDPVALAAEMIKFDTAQSGRGGSDTGLGAVTLPHARMLEAIWRSAGVATELVPTPQPDNAHLLARVTGHGGKPPVLFMAHSDVVTAERDQWTKDPYGGVVENGWLYGRGAIDMKGAAASFMAAILRHVREGARFDRDVIFLSDCDEEGGQYGAPWLVANHFDKVRAGVAITEGGWTMTQQDGATPMIASLSCRDRTSMLVEIVAGGQAAHTSHPDDDQAVVRLARALGTVSRYRTRITLSPLVRDYFGVLAEHTADRRFAAAIRRMLAAKDPHSLDEAGAEVIRASGHPWVHKPMLCTTFSFVGHRTGVYTSIIPSTSRAEVRIGFVPGGDDPGRFVADLRRALLADRVTVRVAGPPGDTEEQTFDRIRASLARPASTTKTDVFDMWRAAARETYPDAGVAASQFEAGTSAAPFRDKGIPVYGLYPFAVDGGTAQRMHGTDERVSVEALRTGTDLVYRLLARMRLT